MLAQGDGGLGVGLERRLVASFAGLDFELRGERAACALLARAPGVSARGGDPSSAGAAFADAPKFAAGCALELLPVPNAADVAPREGAPIAWCWERERGEVLTRAGRAQVWRGARGFEGRAWIAAARGAHPLLAGLTALLLNRSGGAILHAASVVFEGGVVGFIGPSGAGKSTACRHLEGAAVFSVDRLAIARAAAPIEASPWLSHPLSGGTPLPDMPVASPRPLPLLGLLRVQRARDVTAIEPLSRASAVAALRESTFQAGAGASAELALLETLERLARDLPVARLQLALGTTLGAALRRWLLDQGTRER